MNLVSRAFSYFSRGKALLENEVELYMCRESQSTLV